MGNNNVSVRRSYEEAISQLSSVQLSKITEAYKELHSRGGKRGGLVDRSLFTSYFDVSSVLSERLFEAFDRKKVRVCIHVMQYINEGCFHRMGWLILKSLSVGSL